MMGMELVDKDARAVEDVTVSESEKLGVDVVRRCLSDKGEHVPFKKRRFIFRSPSPPPALTPSPHLETSRQLVNVRPAPGQNSCSSLAQRQQLMNTDCLIKSTVPSIDDEKFSELINDFEGFSGTEILAAAACSDGIGDDVTDYDKNTLLEESKEDIIESSVSAMPSEETIASLETACCSPKDSVNEVKVEGSFQDASFAGLHESPGDNDNTTVERSSPLPDDRLLWDLNLSIDAWPCDSGIVDSQKNIVDNLSVKSEELLDKEPQEFKTDTLETEVCSDVNGSNNTSSDLKNMAVGADNLSGAKQESEGCSGSSENKSEPVVGSVVNAENSLMNTAAYINCSVEAVNMDQCPSLSPFGVSDKITPLFVKKEEASVSTHNVAINMVVCSSKAEVGKMFCLESAQVAPCIPVLEMITNDIQKTSDGKDDKDHDAVFGLHVESSVQDIDYPQPLENQAGHTNGAEEMDMLHPSPKSEDMSISGDYVVESMKRTDGASSAYTAQTDSVSHLDSEPLLHSRNCIVSSGVNQFSDHEECRIHDDGPTSYLGKTSLNDPSNESHESALSQDKLLAADMGNHSELQEGYDSQFEDGDLRKSDVQCWDEAEQVNYDTEFEEERSFGFEAESDKKKSKLERGSSLDITGEALRENSVSLKMSTIEGSDAETKKFDYLDASRVRDYDLRVDFSKVSERELVSDVEGSLSSDDIKRSRFDNFDGSYPRAEMKSCSDKFVGRDRSASYMRGRSHGSCGHFFNSSACSWDSRWQHSPSYHRPYNFGRSRPKSDVESRGYSVATDQAPSEAAAVAGPDNRMSRQLMGSSNGLYRPLLRRRSPNDRGRFRRYPRGRGVNRGNRDEYSRHIPDDGTEYFSCMPHRMGRRERSISPHVGRPRYIPYQKPRSRSRSRSPIGWLLPRDQNGGSRRGSIYPDFRSDARMDRVMLPFTKQLDADYGDEFVSPPRSCISPQRNSRMFEDRNTGLGHFRGQNSPLRMFRQGQRFDQVRMFRQGQRFDQVRPIRRMNSDDNFGSMVRPRRFTDMVGGGKGCKYEGNDDDDKHDSRYEMSHRVRRYDTDSAVHRFRYNTEDENISTNPLTVTNAIEVSYRRPDDAPRTANEDGTFKMQP